MANKIRGNKDGPNGSNASYTIQGRGKVPRAKMAREVDAGKHPNFHTITVDGKKYVRGNPDGTENNNVDD
jgi:Protein of unknown function (DUF3892)